ncbi:MAG: hypothetical protein ACRDDL_04935 [Sarcina sp.]
MSVIVHPLSKQQTFLLYNNTLSTDIPDNVFIQKDASKTLIEIFPTVLENTLLDNLLYLLKNSSASQNTIFYIETIGDKIFLYKVNQKKVSKF